MKKFKYHWLWVEYKILYKKLKAEESINHEINARLDEQQDRIKSMLYRLTKIECDLKAAIEEEVL